MRLNYEILKILSNMCDTSYEYIQFVESCDQPRGKMLGGLIMGYSWIDMRRLVK